MKDAGCFITQIFSFLLHFLHPPTPFSLLLRVTPPTPLFFFWEKEEVGEGEVLTAVVLQYDTTACCNTILPEASASKRQIPFKHMYYIINQHLHILELFFFSGR